MITFLAVAAITLDLVLLDVIAPLLPDIQARTGAGDAVLGIAVAAYAAPILVLSLPLGKLADRAGRRPLLIGGISLIIVGSLVIADVHSIGVLILGRVLQGSGSAASWIAALALVADLAPPERRGQALGTAIAATGVGSIAGPAFGGATADLISYPAPFLIIAAAAVLVLIGVVVKVPSGPPDYAEPGSVSVALRRAARTGAGRAGAVVMLGASAGLGLIAVVVPLDYDARLGLSSAAIGLLFTMAVLVDAGAVSLGGRWGDRVGRRRPAVVGLACAALGAGGLLGLPGVAGGALALAVYGAGQGMSFSSGVPWLDDAFGEAQRGIGYAALNVLFAVGYLAGPVAGGLLYALGGRELAYSVLAGVYVLSLAAVLGSRSAR